MGGTWKVPESRYNQGPYERCWAEVEPGPPLAISGWGDPHWKKAHGELWDLHRDKSSTYGKGTDPLANFTTIAATANQEPERYVLERIVEKCARAIHMIDAGNAADVKEYPDIASLGLCAEALLRRRTNAEDSGD